MPNFEILGTLMHDLHQEFVSIYYMMLPVFFALSVVVTWFRSPQGSIEFLDTLKRAIVATVLLAAFPDISRAIIFVADGIAERIDGLQGIDLIVGMAKEKSQGYSLTLTSTLLAFNDLILAVLNFLSFLVLYIARYLTIAMYHFFWVFYMISSPLLLLFKLFPSTSQITANLFRGMIEVACWKIVWAILGAMLLALNAGEMYRIEGSYITLVVMNFIIAIAMLATPMVVRSLVGSGLTAMAPAVSTVTVAAMAAAPLRAMTLYRGGREVVNNTATYARGKFSNLNSNKGK